MIRAMTHPPGADPLRFLQRVGILNCERAAVAEYVKPWRGFSVTAKEDLESSRPRIRWLGCRFTAV
jgi:hypothetical protein